LPQRRIDRLAQSYQLEQLARAVVLLLRRLEGLDSVIVPVGCAKYANCVLQAVSGSLIPDVDLHELFAAPGLFQVIAVVLYSGGFEPVLCARLKQCDCAGEAAADHRSCHCDPGTVGYVCLVSINMAPTRRRVGTPSFDPPALRFAFYGRVSTEDNQDPEASRNWQLTRANALIEPRGGRIVVQFFDIG
jgi:hypothetical protein